jgi:hypothetical protein
VQGKEKFFKKIDNWQHTIGKPVDFEVICVLLLSVVNVQTDFSQPTSLSLGKLFGLSLRSKIES